jgi:hypothetical protein
VYKLLFLIFCNRTQRKLYGYLLARVGNVGPNTIIFVELAESEELWQSMLDKNDTSQLSCEGLTWRSWIFFPGLICTGTAERLQPYVSAMFIR